MEYKDWKTARRIEINYSNIINTLIKELFKAFDFDDPLSFSDIFDMTNSEEFYRLSQVVASKMYNSIYKDNSNNWRKAYKNGTHGQTMYKAIQNELQGPVGNLLRAKINTNAELIRNMPIEMSQEITRYVTAQQMKGRRAEFIAEDLRTKLPHITQARANLIARTECSKADTALNQARSVELGLPAYIWRTSEDGRVRDSHRHMNRVIVFWNNPPSPEKLINAKHTYGNYHAGDIFNCRCYTEPIININYVSFPTKMYNGSNIVSVTKYNLKNLL